MSDADGLILPAPCLVVLMGPSGAGKSTWAATHFAANQIVSSDALRAAVGEGEDDLRASTDAVLPRLALPALVPLLAGAAAVIASIRMRRAVGVRVLADGRDAFLNDEDGQPTEWTFDAVFEPEVLRTAPSVASFQR